MGLITKKDLVSVSVVRECNNNCISCPVSRGGYTRNPSLEEIKNEIDKVLCFSDYIELNGGEPTLRKDIFEILTYIEKRGAKEIGFLTNAQMFYYEKYTQQISKIKNIKIITTIYGHNPKIHDAVTRTPNSFRYKIVGIKNLIKFNVKLELRILLHKMNYKHFEEIINFLIKAFNKDDFVRVVIMNPKLTENAAKYKKTVAEKVTEISKILEKPLKKLINAGYMVALYHFPHCILPKTLQGFSLGFTSFYPEAIFVDQCKDCSKRQACSKIWASYLTVFGSGEFKPIKK